MDNGKTGLQEQRRSPAVTRGKEKMKKYQIIYADPPWNFKVWSDKDGKKDRHYSRMSIEDIKNLPIQKIADKNCILFLWANYPLLPEAFEVIKAWALNIKLSLSTG